MSNTKTGRWASAPRCTADSSGSWSVTRRQDRVYHVTASELILAHTGMIARDVAPLRGKTPRSRRVSREPRARMCNMSNELMQCAV